MTCRSFEVLKAANECFTGNFGPLFAGVFARPFIGGFESAFQTAQEYSGSIEPGVVVVFLLGFFDKRTNTAGAFSALIGSIAINLALKFGMLVVPCITPIRGVFVAALIAAIAVSRMTSEPDEAQTVKLGDIALATLPLSNTLSILVIAILIGLYIWLWWGRIEANSGCNADLLNNSHWVIWGGSYSIVSFRPTFRIWKPNRTALFFWIFDTAECFWCINVDHSRERRGNERGTVQ